MMTGLMPSGKFHLGHKIVTEQIIFYQKLGAKVYVAVADIEAYNTRNPDLQELKEFEGPIPVVVPVGIDQDPHLRIARDISQRIKVNNFLQLSSTYHKFLPGLDTGKMSSSNPNSYIALTDSAKEVEIKIKKYAFSGGQPTVKEHKEKGGNPDIDISYQYLTFFEENDKKLEKIYNDYKS